MPVKSRSGSVGEQKLHDEAQLQKRQIEMPDGRYMIFYSELASRKQPEEAPFMHEAGDKSQEGHATKKREGEK